ncbi:MAG: endonuclease/exonuclease/phosphatase family protein [Persicimonas sp.]
MTYNIRLGLQQGVDAVARVVKEHAPDILALQEVGRHWIMGPPGDTTAQLAEMVGLPHYQYVTTIHEEDDARYGHALLARWPIEARDIFRFSQDIDEPRAALIAQVDRDDGPLTVVSTHLSHRDAERQMHGTELVELVAGVLSPTQPTLLMGDLNEDDAEWLGALEDKMESAGGRAGECTYPNPDPCVRIDYIMAHGGRFTAARVVDDKTTSDHRPVVAEVAFD